MRKSPKLDERFFPVVRLKFKAREGGALECSDRHNQSCYS